MCPMPELTAADVWRVLEKSTVAVLGHVTLAGAPRTSGIVYAAHDRRAYIAIDPQSWKARQIATGDQVSMTVLVHRGGVLPLLFPIPPATITFHGAVAVHPAGSAQAQPLLAHLKRLLPPDRRDSSTILEVTPRGHFLTYGIGVPLRAMRDPESARARVPVS